MTLRAQGVDKDNAQRGADHVRRGTNEGGEKGAVTAAVQALRWLGLFVGTVIIVLAIVKVASAAAPETVPAKPTSANFIHLPMLGKDCRIKCSSSVPYPTLTPTPFINEPPMPTAPAVNVEVQ